MRCGALAARSYYSGPHLCRRLWGKRVSQGEKVILDVPEDQLSLSYVTPSQHGVVTEKALCSVSHELPTQTD